MIPIVPITSSSLKLAKELSQQFHLPVVMDKAGFNWLLQVTDERVELISTTEKRFAPIWIDFLYGKLHHRLQTLSIKKELIARAVGMKGQFKPFVLDVTAGWGRDAFVLASLGCKVVMVERSPVMAVLLQDGLRRLFSSQTQISSQTLSLVFADARQYLESMQESPDVIYLDPMYPDRTKTALVKKEMRILREVVGEQEDADALFLQALLHANKRVVVKRPLYGEMLHGAKPTCQFLGKSTRFDVYTSRT